MRRSLLWVGVLALLGPAAAGAQAPAPLQVIVFPGGFNWPIWAALEKGFFAAEGLDVKLTLTPSSVFQLQNLIEGKFDVGMTAFDNVVAYQEGQGEATVSSAPDLFVFMGGDNGFLRLVVVPGGADLRRPPGQGAVGRRAHDRILVRAPEDAAGRRPEAR